MNYSIDFTIPVPDLTIKNNKFSELERSNRMMRWREKKQFDELQFISEIRRNNHSQFSPFIHEARTNGPKPKLNPRRVLQLANKAAGIQNSPGKKLIDKPSDYVPTKEYARAVRKMNEMGTMEVNTRNSFYRELKPFK